MVRSDLSEPLLARAWARRAIAEIAPALRAYPGEVFLVGGAVRDLMLGRALLDVDLALDADPGELARGIGGSAPAVSPFGTVSVERAGCRYDLARTRRERYPRPGALPEVEPAGIDTDLARRDFTVNALALALTGDRAGELLAAPGALEDLAAGRLAVLHEASFRDDPTRLLRLARYGARLHFRPAETTRELAHAAIAAGALTTLSGPRLGHELALLAREPDPVAAFQAAADLGLPWTVAAGPARRALAVLPADGRADLLVLAAVFPADAPARLRAELDRLGFLAEERETIVAAARDAAPVAERLAAAASGAEIARAAAGARPETVALAFGRGAADQALTWLNDLRHRALSITGDDLIAHGLVEGPQIGAALQAAADALADGRAPDRESQLTVALRAGG